MKRHLLALLLAVTLGSLHAAGQSMADLMQRAIYAQETVGDFDAAIKIYRQVLSLASASRGYPAQAQYRLGQCLLGKGAKVEAAAEFKKFVTEYPEQKDLLAKARESLRELGAFIPLEYRDAVTGFSFAAPPEFRIAEKRWSDGSVTVSFDNRGQPFGSAGFYVEGKKTPAAEIDRRMHDDLDRWLKKWSQGVSPYHVRPGTVALRQVGRHHVLSCIAERLTSGGDAWTEYLVWVVSEQTRVFFSVGSDGNDLARNQEAFDRIIETVQIP